MNDTFLPGNGFDTYEEQDRVLMGLSGSVRSGVAVRILQQQAVYKRQDHGRAGGRQRFGCSRGRAGRAGDRGKRRRPRRPARRLSDGAWIWQKVMKIWDFWLKNSCKKTETVIL